MICGCCTGFAEFPICNVCQEARRLEGLYGELHPDHYRLAVLTHEQWHKDTWERIGRAAERRLARPIRRRFRSLLRNPELYS